MPKRDGVCSATQASAVGAMLGRLDALELGQDGTAAVEELERGGVE
jgi:hypothetical protein